MKFRRIFFVFSLSILCAGISVVVAKAPDTAKIAFVSNRDGNREIYIMNPDGTEKVRLTQNFAVDLYPIWSPTGEKILFVSDRDGNRDLYLMDANGSNVQRVFKKSARREHPTWSPDGKQIAYVRGWFIYIATLGKQEEQQLVNGFDPAWSPDGSEIAFLSGAFDEPRRISLLRVRTRKQTFLPFPKVPMWVRGPMWSPNGEKIAFAWQPEGFEVETIYIMNRDGTEVQQIVAPKGSSAGEPTWAPRGNALLYVQVDDGDDLQIFRIDLENDEAIQLGQQGSLLSPIDEWI